VTVFDPEPRMVFHDSAFAYLWCACGHRSEAFGPDAWLDAKRAYNVHVAGCDLAQRRMLRKPVAFAGTVTGGPIPDGLTASIELGEDTRG
jgi:hypothetical protein